MQSHANLRRTARPKRLKRWIAAAVAGVSALISAQSAMADYVVPGIGPEDFSFTKSAKRLSCNYVEYTMTFTGKGRAGVTDDPAKAGEFDLAQLGFRDQLQHPGLSWVAALVTVSGDATGPGGGPFNIALSTTSHANDTLNVNALRFSATSTTGTPLNRTITIRALARIDRSMFPAPATVSNQARMRVLVLAAHNLTYLSDTPAEASGDTYTGIPTPLNIDLSSCPDAVAGDPVTVDPEACFKTEAGTVGCSPAAGVITYTMAVPADYAGRFVELTPLTPGITVLDPPQVVPAGGGTLTWHISGASSGMILEFIANGLEGDIKDIGGVTNGLTLCCTQKVKIVVPADLPCLPLAAAKKKLSKEPVKKPRVADLEITKRALDKSCAPGGPCAFEIIAKNVGGKAYAGPVHLNETVTPAGAEIANVSNGWTCRKTGASTFGCHRANVRLGPGKSVALKIGFKPAAGAAFVSNCARVNYSAMKTRPFGSFLNDAMCAQIPVCEDGSCGPTPPQPEGTPKLELTKTALGSQCRMSRSGESAQCRFAIAVENSGNGVHRGPVSVDERFETPVSAARANGNGWVCKTRSGSGHLKCDHANLVLAPGARSLITVTGTVRVDPKGDKVVKNCARLYGEASFGPQSCATVTLPDPGGEQTGTPELTIGKTCKPAVLGAPVSCRITVTNSGDGVHKGKITVNDVNKTAAGGELALSTVTPDVAGDWSCGKPGSGTLACAIEGAKVPAGETRFFDVTFNLPAGATFKNCASGTIQGRSDVHDLNEACVRAGVELVVDKTGPGKCDAGQTCTFAVTVANNSASDFAGTVALSDVTYANGNISAGLEVVSIAPRLPCGIQPTKLPFSCDASLSLKGGSAKTYKITVRLPEDASGSYRNCAMVSAPGLVNGSGVAKASTTSGQPGGEVEGPLSCVSFEVTKPTPTCRAPLVLKDNGSCGCPKGQRWNGRRCVGQPSEPVPPVTVIPPTPPVVVIDPPRCERHETTVRSRRRASIARREGRRVRYLANSAGRVWCVSGEAERPECDAGEQTLYSRRAAQNWREKGGDVRVERAGGQTIWCAAPLPPPLSCNRDERSTRNPREARTWRSDGLLVRLLRRGNDRLWCGREVNPCRGNERLVTSSRAAKRLAERNAPVRVVRYRGERAYCVGPIQPTVDPCRRGETTVRSRAALRRYRSGDFAIRSVRTRQGTVWCVRPAPRPEPPCAQNERTVRNGNVAKRMSGRFRVRQVAPSKWCVGPPIVTPPVRPPCIGGRLRRRGQRYYCQCPAKARRIPVGNQGGARCERGPICQQGQILRGNRCVWPPCPRGQVRRGQVCVPVLRPCLPGQIRRGNRCVWQPCPRGQVRRGPVCVPVLRPCLPGQIRRGNRCVWRPCPPGTRRVGNSCQRIVIRPCPPGTIGRFPNCRRIIRPRPGPVGCPPGMYRTPNGRCIRLR